MTDTPADVAAKLEARAADCDQQVRHAVWPALAQQAIDEAKLLRAAASMLRDMSEREKALREALEPFAREVGRFGRGNSKRAVKIVMEDRDGHPAIDLLVSDFEAAHAAIVKKEPGHGA